MVNMKLLIPELMEGTYWQEEEPRSQSMMIIRVELKHHHGGWGLGVYTDFEILNAHRVAIYVVNTRIYV